MIKSNVLIIFALVLFISIIMIINIDRSQPNDIYDIKASPMIIPSYKNRYDIIVSNSPICTNIDNKCNYFNNSNVNNDIIKTIKGSTDCQYGCPKNSFCYLGTCICHPGFTGHDCGIRLKGNPFNILDCPNLSNELLTTMDIDAPLDALGGEHSQIKNKTLCNPPTNPKFCSYLCYSHNAYGVAVVPTELWRAAQFAEANLWKQIGSQALPTTDANDRSIEHWSAFDNLNCLENNIRFGQTIEVGAGPWTQIKGFLHIRSDITIDKLTVWEPSAERYMKEVPTCSYKNSKLARYGNFKGVHDDFEVIINSKGGELLGNNSEYIQYDTLISINVIEHVQDAFKYFTGLYKSIKTGGLLIFHDRYYDDDTVVGGDHYHPIRIKKSVIDRFLSGFNIIYNNCTAHYDNRKNEKGYYVVARKL
jgi:hypothetical protein